MEKAQERPLETQQCLKTNAECCKSAGQSEFLNLECFALPG